MERLAQKHIPQAGRLATTRGLRNFIIKNFGTGPALNLSFDFAPIESNPDPDEIDLSLGRAKVPLSRAFGRAYGANLAIAESYLDVITYNHLTST